MMITATIIILGSLFGMLGSLISIIENDSEKNSKKKTVLLLVDHVVLFVTGWVVMFTSPRIESQPPTEPRTPTELTTTTELPPRTVTQSAEKKFESLRGRGLPDEGRNEPHYDGGTGYIVVSSNEEFIIKKKEEFQNTSYWVVPTYRIDKQFMVETNVKLPHKTKVVVKEQKLHHMGYGAYTGFLRVELPENGKQYYINVKNFVTRPYWTYTDNVLLAAQTGAFIAKYKQVSDFYPTSSNGRYKIDIPDGTIVLVSGTETIYPYGKRVKAIARKESGGKNVVSETYFHPDDLSIIH